MSMLYMPHCAQFQAEQHAAAVSPLRCLHSDGARRNSRSTGTECRAGTTALIIAEERSYLCRACLTVQSFKQNSMLQLLRRSGACTVMERGETDVT